MTNRYLVIGWLGGNSELFQDYDMDRGKATAQELKKSPAWRHVWDGPLIGLIMKLEKEDLKTP